ncbi:thiosulfate sulfurtransferase 18 isoform X2 [Raphanus sativus]|uniref:Thiosulfate sulfurtransferase 18 isoform X2 n=1 Tax=Raphanus sativus TaxID=3726 RepID=A0A9W3BZB0_RAPSA|nr:thiosulfate sulfurtransferase 18 isoform X2 [Raphanus sativus]
MFPSVCSSKPGEVVNVDVSQAKTLLQSDHQYLDVRTEEEFRRGHCFVPKILNVPYMLNSPQGRVKNQDFLDQVSSLLNPTDDILVGFEKVRNVGGGYQAWVDHNFPIIKEQQQSAN